MLTIRNLSKTYADGVRALRDVSLDIPNGMFGLLGLGPNGAGKSTLMRTIATLQDPDSGSIRLGDSVITLTVDGKPYEAGIDPFNELVDRVSNDNRAPVTIQ